MRSCEPYYIQVLLYMKVGFRVCNVQIFLGSFIFDIPCLSIAALLPSTNQYSFSATTGCYVS